MLNKLEYVEPERVGVSSKAIEHLLDQLENDITEPHGLMMTRHGKVFAEGYWKPYTAGMVHGMQSLTKTFAGTAIGIAMELGIVNLEEKIMDIFPKEAMQTEQKYLSEMRVHHVLSMSTGMRSVPSFEGNWIVNFLNNPIVDRPGKKFFYNSVGSTLLGEIIRRKTGDSLDEFLKKHLYDQIGIDPKGMKWLKLKDGLEIGGSGLYSTLENNTRLGLLYLNQGQWNGRQIISREFCRKAVVKQIDNGNLDNEPSDGHMGYGYQMWMGLHKNTYCMCGAWGQYTIMCPDEDIVISFSGRTNDAIQASSNTLMSKFWNFLNTGVDQKMDLEETNCCIRKRLSELSLPAVKYQPYGDIQRYSGEYQITMGEFDLDLTTGGIMQSCYQIYPIDKMRFKFINDVLLLEYHNELGDHLLTAGMDGLPRLNNLITPPFPCSKVYASAAFEEDRLELSVRWIETCYSARIVFWQEKGGMVIKKIFDEVDPMGPDVLHWAWAEAVK